MATLTIEMIRKRAEHNDGILHSLEELSLNQLGLINLGFVAEEEEREGTKEHHHRRQRLRRRSLLPRVCRRLRHLSLAGNSLPRLPCGPRDLGLCKELRTLNVALNAIERIAGGSGAKNNDGGEEKSEEEEGPLSSCESLQRLDLSGNFVSKTTIRGSVRSLASAPVLDSLWLSGCPVAVGWEGYRRFVVGSLPRLRELDGVAITAIERIEASEALAELERELVECERQEKRKEKGGDESGGESDASCSSSENDLRSLEREADLLEEQVKKQQEATGGDGEAKMPWSRAARLLLARETAAAAAAGTAGERGRRGVGGGKMATKASSGGLLFERVVEPVLTSMPPWSSSSDEAEDDASSGEGEGEEKRSRRRRRQRDDGSWPFALFPSRDGAPLLVLEVALGLSSICIGSEIELDVRPRHVRVFAGGSLLCARLPGRVDPSKARARRSLASGRLVVEMPLADPREELDEACVREWGGGGAGRGRGRGLEVRRGGGGGGALAGRVIPAPAAAAAVVVVAAEEEEEGDDDGSSSPPPLLPQKLERLYI